MTKYDSADNLVRFRRSLRELIERGAFAQAEELIERLEDTDVDDDDVSSECARWRFHLELTAAYAHAA